MEELCFLRGPRRDVVSKGQGQLIISSVLESVKRGLESVKRRLEHGRRGIAIVRAVTRKRLVTD
jgi:hypothetical protein